MTKPLKKVAADKPKEVHVCGQCHLEFDSEAGYLKHKCKATGFTPVDPKHLGPEFEAISQAALARGEAHKSN